VKNRSPQLVEMLVEQGASLDTACFNKTIAAHIREKMPDLDLATLSQSRRMRAPLVKQASTSVMERLAQILDQAALGKVIHFIRYFTNLLDVMTYFTKKANINPTFARPCFFSVACIFIISSYCML
jgi:hypothetical protein